MYYLHNFNIVFRKSSQISLLGLPAKLHNEVHSSNSSTFTSQHVFLYLLSNLNLGVSTSIDHFLQVENCPAVVVGNCSMTPFLPHVSCHGTEMRTRPCVVVYLSLAVYSHVSKEPNIWWALCLICKVSSNNFFHCFSSCLQNWWLGPQISHSNSQTHSGATVSFVI